MESSLAPSVSAPFFSESSWKRFQDGILPHIPVVTLDREGNIKTLTRAARQLLEYSSDEALKTCFFSLVHKRNVGRVMRDLAHMVCRGKQRAQWLLRLRTGNDRWRWYRASAENNLGGEEDGIVVRLRPV